MPSQQESRPENLGGGLWTVPVPIPDNPLGTTLVYALESDRGPVLIDAGWNHPDAWQALSGGLEAMGTSVADVYGVVVTHHHPDHAGLAGKVREASGAWVAMHHADVEIVRVFREVLAADQDRSWEKNSMAFAGASAEELAQVGPGGTTGHIDPPAVPDRELADGDLVDLPGRKLRVIWTPGHSPGHICLHLEDGDRIFTGDHVLPRITPHIGLYPYDTPEIDPLGDFLESLGRIAEIEATHVLPAHQNRFTGLRERANAISAHHEERLAEVIALLSAAPRTLWDIAGSLSWNRTWESMSITNRRMAAGETAAHIRTLESRGTVRRAGPASPLSFALA